MKKFVESPQFPLWMSLVGIAIFVGVILALVFGEQASSTTAEEMPAELTTVSNISQILVSRTAEGQVYTLYVDQEGGKVGELRLVVHPHDGPHQIFRDAEPGKPSYVTYYCKSSWDSRLRTCNPIPKGFSYWEVFDPVRMSLHLHSAKEINGNGGAKTIN